MVKRPLNGGAQTWKKFLENHRDGIASMDFIIVPTIHFELLYCLIIINHARRIIRAYVRYYNNVQTHVSLERSSPAVRKVQLAGAVTSMKHLGGLHHECVKI